MRCGPIPQKKLDLPYPNALLCNAPRTKIKLSDWISSVSVNFLMFVDTLMQLFWIKYSNLDRE